MSKDTVVFVHGLWMNGLDMILLQKRLARAGYATRRFPYSSLHATPCENAEKLQDFRTSIDSKHIHYVCHSLGGLVVRHLFSAHPDQPPGRIVTLGTPHSASMAARQLNKIAPGRKLLGKSIIDGLLGGVPPWQARHELGVIAGTLRLGFGMIIPHIPKPNDGTIAVAETRLEGMTDHIILPVSHFGMLLSKEVARQIIHFLKHGAFNKKQTGKTD